MTAEDGKRARNLGSRRFELGSLVRVVQGRTKRLTTWREASLIIVSQTCRSWCTCDGSAAKPLERHGRIHPP
jgi:hypothetical protein